MPCPPEVFRHRSAASGVSDGVGRRLPRLQCQNSVRYGAPTATGRLDSANVVSAIPSVCVGTPPADIPFNCVPSLPDPPPVVLLDPSTVVLLDPPVVAAAEPAGCGDTSAGAILFEPPPERWVPIRGSPAGTRSGGTNRRSDVPSGAAGYLSRARRRRRRVSARLYLSTYRNCAMSDHTFERSATRCILLIARRAHAIGVNVMAATAQRYQQEAHRVATRSELHRSFRRRLPRGTIDL